MALPVSAEKTVPDDDPEKYSLSSPTLPHLSRVSLLLQLAVSFLHYDEIELFDFETILPNSDAKPLLTLTPGGRGGSGGFRAGQGGGMSAASRPSGRSRGLGHLSFEFVLKGSPGNIMTHVVAGGREGTFRVWRFGPRSAGQLTPYLQVRVEPAVGAERSFDRVG